MPAVGRKHGLLFFIPACLAVLCFAVLCFLLHVRPDRLIGAAFCHQLAARSPEFSFPFCYRCSGLFSGIFWGMAAAVLRPRTDKLLSRFSAAAIIVSLGLFLTDIVNTTEYIPVRFYRESIPIRFLSSYPLGFFLSSLVADLYQYLFRINKDTVKGKMLITAAFLCAGCLISYLLVFSGVRFLTLLTGYLIAAGSLAFLIVLYSILVKCISMLRGSSSTISGCLAASVFLAFCHINLLGSLHLYFFNFNQLF